jgi:PAS domain S-box-containing protein
MHVSWRKKGYKMVSLIHILHLEDDPADAELVQARIEEAGLACRLTRVQTRDEFDEALRRDGYDIILSDYRLPMYDGMSALLLAQELRPDVPFIFVSGTMGEEAAIEGLREGATDYVLKQRLLRLAPAIKRALHEAENRREHNRAEEALRASEEKYRIVADFTYDWEAWLAPDGTYRYVSPSCERITGHTAADFLADPNLVLQITHPDDQSKVIEHYHEATHKSREQDLKIDFRILTSGGEIRWISHWCIAVFGEGGQWLGRRESNRDISQQKQAEAEKEKIEAQNLQLQKAESLGRMAGAIAHHFNNQFHAVMGNLEMAMHGLQLGVNPTERLASAMHAARKAAEVCGLMLAYLGQTPGKHEHIDLSKACRQSLTLVQATAPKNMTIKSDFPTSGPFIRANAGQILHILTNLITNAWESADENRRSIRLTIKSVSQEKIPTSKCFPIDWQPRDPAYACLEVADAGCGIAEKDFEKIFDPFFSTKFTGRGMGLPVVLGIVRAHLGAVTVESEPDRGSIFRVYFPVSVEEVPNQPDKTSQPPEMEGGGTVLLVEDETLVREIGETMLAHLGFRVIEAKDGVDAVEVFRRHQDEIRYVICDLTMPRMGGWDTLAALRKLSPDIPVILSSGCNEVQVMAGEHPERPNAFLSKPYQLKGLRDTINRVLA